MRAFNITVITASILGVFFFASGAVNIIGASKIREAFRRWGYPNGFHLLNGALQILAGGLILFSPTRAYGLALAAIVCIIAALTLVKAREYNHLPPSGILLAIILAVAVLR